MMMLNHGRKKLKIKNEKLKMMVKLFLTLFSIHYSLFTLLSAASVEATVNTQEVVKGNPVQLRIKAIGGSAAFPNIHDINGARVTNSGTSRQSSMQITVNGMQKETSTVRKYIFVPEHDMTIPSYSVRIGGDNYKTKPLHIRVVESHAPKLQKNEKFSFQLKSDKSTVSVGESFVITVYMSISQSLQGIQVSEYVAPNAPDFFIKEITGQNEYEHDGYTIIEKRYIVTPKKEGNFTIEAAKAKLGQPDWTKQDIFGRPGTSWMPIVSNVLPIEVKALQTDADVVGDFTLNTKIDAQKVKANKPINLTIHIEGKGSLEDFEFPKYEIDGVTIYSDEAKVESHLEGTELVSSYSKSFAFISENDFTIPVREISAYNPQTKETKMLKVPSYDITIEGNKNAVVVPTSHNVVETKEPIAPEVISKEVEVKTTQWWMLALAFGLGVLFMYLVRFFPKLFQSKEKSYRESDALKILYSHISEDKAVEEMVRKLYARKNGDKSVQIDKKELKAMVERFR